MGQTAVGQDARAIRTATLGVGAVILLLTVLSYVRFPGHTYLQSDTQIYLPILEHYWDHTVFNREILALRPHVSFTIYDEVALALRHLTRLDFETLLDIQQLIFRAAGILGVFLLATALGLSRRMGLLVAAIFTLGASITGPAVLVLEYEPVPRAFAVPLLLLASGLAAHGRDWMAGCCAALAFLYQPPAVWPFWGAYFAMTLWPSKPAVMRRRIWGLLPILLGVVVLLVLSRLQSGVTEPQQFFSSLDPFIEKLQRGRGWYVWISMWPHDWIWHYVLLFGLSMLAFWRVRASVSEDARFLLIGLPVAGLVSVPLSFFLLEKVKWALIPQAQPARALVFLVAMAGILATIAAVKAAERRRYWETALWFILAFSIPAYLRVQQVVWPDLADPLVLRRFSLTLCLAGLATLAAWAGTNKWSWAPWALTLLLPFFLVPTWGAVQNYPQLRNPELTALSDWARTRTDKNAMFLFPDAGRELYPGIFRAGALRPVYVDWKSGGQVNFLAGFAHEWWKRWQLAGQGFEPADAERYRKLGIDFFVLKSSHRLPGLRPVFENSRFLVYPVRH